jgi:Icc-related predicted phosphoesterase
MRSDSIMKLKIFFIAALAAIFLVSSRTCGQSTAAQCPDSSGNRVVFISDTQKPMWFEKIFVKTHRNEEATGILLRSIQNDTTVRKVFFLGDIVSIGSINRNWRKIDTFLVHLRSRNVDTYAAAGNHDYLFSSVDGEANIKKRFPAFVRTGYCVRDGKLAVILLNSNFSELSHSEKKQQQEWYTNELRTLDSDTSVDLVIVCCHHPPYSNSSIVGFSKKVREKFVPPFRNSAKGRVFISGHAHTFQHFADSLKHFLVIGGGGGLLHTLKKTKPGDPQDLVDWKTKYRMFHYVVGSYVPGGFLLTVMMLTEDLQGPRPVYKIFIPLKM